MLACAARGSLPDGPQEPEQGSPTQASSLPGLLMAGAWPCPLSTESANKEHANLEDTFHIPLQGCPRPPTPAHLLAPVTPTCWICRCWWRKWSLATPRYSGTQVGDTVCGAQGSWCASWITAPSVCSNLQPAPSQSGPVRLLQPRRTSRLLQEREASLCGPSEQPIPRLGSHSCGDTGLVLCRNT